MAMRQEFRAHRHRCASLLHHQYSGDNTSVILAQHRSALIVGVALSTAMLSGCTADRPCWWCVFAGWVVTSQRTVPANQKPSSRRSAASQQNIRLAHRWAESRGGGRNLPTWAARTGRDVSSAIYNSPSRRATLVPDGRGMARIHPRRCRVQNYNSGYRPRARMQTDPYARQAMAKLELLIRTQMFPCTDRVQHAPSLTSDLSASRGAFTRRRPAGQGHVSR